MRRRLAATALVLLLLAPTGLGPMTPSAWAAGRPSAEHAASAASSTTEASGSGMVTPDIIPRPNSGQPPNSPGDRGGSEQTALFLLICAAIVLLGVLAYLEGRRNKRRRARLGQDRPPLAHPAGSPTAPSASSPSSSSQAP